ncbi:Ammonium transporter [hydrothermal vent metagenome]|uniref:Ammonium transporter n=1 Tax=hydrothermal vent metagenome TaxID=652676 RepID=A0A3B0Z0F4_9ZZZZ
MLATVVFTAVMTLFILKLVGIALGGLRVSAEEEAQGLDISSHEERGYVNL